MHVWWNGRHVRLRGVWGNPCKFKSCHVHHLFKLKDISFVKSDFNFIVSSVLFYLSPCNSFFCLIFTTLIIIFIELKLVLNKTSQIIGSNTLPILTILYFPFAKTIFHICAPLYELNLTLRQPHYQKDN